MNNIERGWLNGAPIGDASARLIRVRAHWVNLPPLDGLQVISDGVSTWHGRWQTEAEGWKIVIDARPDLRAVWQDRDLSDGYLVTHVMEITRADGSDFDGSELEPVLEAIYLAVSFAVGHFVFPALAIGEDASGSVLWQEWRTHTCDPAKDPQGWWYHGDLGALEELIGKVVKGFIDPTKRMTLRLRLNLAISTIRASGFVEQRVMTGAAGLEHIMWEHLVLRGGMTKDRYRRDPAHELLHATLKDASISSSLDSRQLPVSVQWAKSERRRQGRVLDGVDVLTQIRNWIVHPQDDQEPVYRFDGFVAELWLLTRHYLALLLLNKLGYTGSYRDLREPSGFAANVGKVPWAP